MGTRDDMCGMDVARMEELGGFAEEISVIGCAYKVENEVLYRVTDAPEEAYQFYESAARNGILPTLPQIYVRREIIPAGQRERMTDEAKIACARQMHAVFDQRFWQYFDTLKESAATNSAYTLLARYRKMLEGRFSHEPLELFEVFLNEALNRHRLTSDAYAEFAAWLDENYEKMADDWIVKEQYERTFYGFASYRDPSALNVRVDTAPFNLMQRQLDMQTQGVAVTPIFKKTAQYRESAALTKVRRQFQEWVQKIIDQFAVPFEQFLVNGEKPVAPFDLHEIASLSDGARETVAYYLRLWGMQ